MDEQKAADAGALAEDSNVESEMVVGPPEQSVPRSRRRDLVEYDGLIYDVDYDSDRGGYFIVDNDGYERDVVLDENLGEFHVDDDRYDDHNEEGDQ